MSEELLTLSSSEEEEDIKIVEEKISFPGKVKKIQQVVEDLHRQGHFPRAAASKVRNVQLLSAQGALSLEEEEEE